MLRSYFPNRSNHCHRASQRMHFEQLEDRRVLATFLVNEIEDLAIADDGKLTLREAIAIVSEDYFPDEDLRGGVIDGDYDQIIGDPGVDDIIDLTAIAGEIELVHGQMNIMRSVTITGPGRDLLTIDADSDADGVGNSRIFEIDGQSAIEEVEISGLTLKNGNAASGGALRYIISQFETVPLALELKDVSLVDNHAFSSSGGGVDIIGAHFVFLDGVIADGNSAFGSGGSVAVSSTESLEVRHSSFYDNHAGSGGAVSAHTKKLIVDESIFGEHPSLPGATGNAAAGGGGGGALRYQYFGTALDDDVVDVEVTNSHFESNEASSVGGAIYFVPHEEQILRIAHTDYYRNVISDVGLGGAISVHSTAKEFTLDNVELVGNVSGPASSRADGTGGGALLIALEFDSDSPGFGGVVTIKDSLIKDNQTSGQGGGIAAVIEGDESSLRIENSEISNNGAYLDGGGVFMLNGDVFPSSNDAGVFEIVDSVIAANYSSARGGGVYVDSRDNQALPAVGISLIERSTISGNSAGTDGGGIWGNALGDDHVPLMIRDSAIFENEALGDGGGLFLSSSPLDSDATAIYIINSTIAKNFANNGGGIASNGEGTLIAHSTITDNSAGPRRFSPTDPEGTLGEMYSAGGGIYFSEFRDHTQVQLDHTIVAGNNHYPDEVEDGEGNSGGETSEDGQGYSGNYSPDIGSSIRPADYDDNPPVVPVDRILMRYTLIGNVQALLDQSLNDVIVAIEIPDVDTMPIHHDQSLWGGEGMDLGLPLEDIFHLDSGGRPRLANNGGPTKTVQLAYWGEHLALDRGDPSFTPTAELAYDQRGSFYVREYNLEPEYWPNNAPKFHFHDVNHQIDIGAFEVRPPLLLADYNLDNSVGLGDYAVWRDLLGLKDIPYGVGADGNNDGDIDQLDYTFWKAKFGGMIVIDVPADFNLDGTVNLADYGLWRDQLGSTVIPYSGLDVDGDGIVGIEEYQIWKKNFGATHSGAAFGIATLPGDYNADGTVNDDDYNLWEQNFGSTTNLDADGNGNGIVDLADLEILQANYMSTTLDILPGDFDGNGVVDTADYDLWFIGDPSADADGDSDVDQDDYDIWDANFGLVDAGLAPYIQNPGTGLPFEIPMQAPQVVGIKISASAGGDYDFGSVVGSGEQLRTVPVANANKLSVTFSEEVFVTSTALTVTNLDGTDPTVAAFEYDIATQTATWSFTSSLADGRHLFRLADSIIDLDQESLDGDFANPWSLSDTETAAFGSGDGEAGGEFRFRATILAGDTDRDNIDGTTDYTDWLAVEPGMILASNTADELDGDHSYGDVSLREAVQLANAATEPTKIVLREGRYVLTRVGTEVGDASYNDLNVTGDVTVIGMGAGISVIEGFGDSYTGSPYSQRIFDIQGSGARFELNGLTLTRSVSDYSGIIVGTTVYAWNQATVLIRDSVFVANSHVGPYWGGGVGTAVAASGASSLTILGSVFTSNTGYQGAAVYSGGTDLTIGSSIFALNNAVHNTPNVNITGTPVLKNLGNNLYDDASGGFFDTIPATGDHLGIPDYVVTSIADTFDHTDDEEALSIREAIDLANQNDGVAEEIWLPAWDFVLTRDRVNFGNGAATGSPSGPTDTDIAFGDLDITDSLTIRGVTGAMSGRLTSVRWREDLPVDAIFDLLGDYNGDGISNGEDSGTVSLGDYSIWGDTLGSTTDLRADGDDDGIIDQDDRDIWSDHFGNWLDLIDIAINET